MENWDYYISGIWKTKTNGIEHITDVFLHDAANGFGKGVKTGKDEVIELIRNGAKITTITWNYHLIQWRFGARVEYAETEGESALRSSPEATTFDDLESAIQMQYILTDDIPLPEQNL